MHSISTERRIKRMKKILLVNKSFETGGIQSSMVNMANELSRFYSVDLFIYNPKGPMKARLNENVTVIEACGYLKALCMTPKEMLKSKNVSIMAFWLFANAWTKLFGNKLPIDMAIKRQKKLSGYDLAIAYHQEQRRKTTASGFSRVVDKCVDASVKTAWLHFDSNTVKLDDSFNNPFYEKMDRIVCVSRSLMEACAANNPSLADKMDYCYNFMTYEDMLEKSRQPQIVNYPQGNFVCFSVCRIVNVKALDRAVNAIAEVLKKHPEIVWYIAGDGPEKANVEEAIRRNGLEDKIVLIGNQSNPYPYMKNADLLMNVSYNEAAPMVFFEAKAMGVPVFATRTSSAEELLCDGVDAFICDNSEDGIAKAFEALADNKEMVLGAKKHLDGYTANNGESLKKIESLLDFGTVNDERSR